MAFCEELCANQDIALAAPDLDQGARELGAPARAVAVDAHDARFREARGERLFHALRAAAHGLEIHIAAGRARARNGLLRAAMVAVQASIGGMQHEPPGAARAARIPAAGVARQHGRIAAAVDEHQALLAPRKASADRLEDRRTETLLGGMRPQVDGAHGGEPRAWRSALREHDALGTPLAEVVPALQRWRLAAEHHGTAGALRSVDRRAARRVPRALLLLAGAV